MLASLGRRGFISANITPKANLISSSLNKMCFTSTSTQFARLYGSSSSLSPFRSSPALRSILGGKARPGARASIGVDPKWTPPKIDDPLGREAAKKRAIEQERISQKIYNLHVSSGKPITEEQMRAIQAESMSQDQRAIVEHIIKMEEAAKPLAYVVETPWLIPVFLVACASALVGLWFWYDWYYVAITGDDNETTRLSPKEQWTKLRTAQQEYNIKQDMKIQQEAANLVSAMQKRKVDQHGGYAKITVPPENGSGVWIDIIPTPLALRSPVINAMASARIPYADYAGEAHFILYPNTHNAKVYEMVEKIKKQHPGKGFTYEVREMM